MFDIGWTELLVIAVVAVIIVGPKDLPAMLRTLGRYAGKLKRTAGEFRAQFDDALRESEFDDLRSTMSEMSNMNPANQIRDSVNEGLNPLKESADKIKKDVEGTGGGATPGRMNTDPTPAKQAPSGSASGKSEPESAQKKPKAAAKTTRKKTASTGKSGGTKKAAPRKKSAPAKSASSGSAAKTGS